MVILKFDEDGFVFLSGFTPLIFLHWFLVGVDSLEEVFLVYINGDSCPGYEVPVFVVLTHFWILVINSAEWYYQENSLFVFFYKTV